MKDEQLLRYNRQIMLPDIDIDGQQKINDARVLVVGLGGLGSPVALYLASSGVGHLTLLDFDTVDLSNLQRQIIHHTDDIGKLKVSSAKEKLQAINPEIVIATESSKLDQSSMEAYVIDADVVVDCSDNFTTRYALNDLAIKHQKVLVSGAAINLEGQVSVFDFRNDQSPCYRCLYSEGDELAQTCSESGVLGPVVGVVGSLQALETVKVLADIGESLQGRLLVFDARYCEWRSLNLKRDPSCLSCANR